MPFICFPKDPISQFSRQSLAHLRQHGGNPTVGYQAREINTALGLVSAGLGVTLVGKTVSQNNRTDITFLPLNAEPLNSKIYAVAAHDASNSIVENFIQILRCA
jgi:DNA-binding transcriptional LysR family regulator